MKTKTPSSNVSPRFSLGLAPALVVAALIAWCPLPTRANTIALSFTGGTTGSPAANSTFGWAFTLSSPVLLTDLGIWDESGDGLFESHLVTLWTSTGTPVVGAQGTVPSGTAGTLANGFRYVSIVPVLLAAGNYTIGAHFTFSNDDVVFDATITTASGVTYNGSRNTLGNAFPPSDPGNHANSYFGPNFQFTDLPTNGVPDAGSTLTVFLLGLTATVGPKFFVRRSA